MGVSTNAIVFYGYCFDGEGPIWKEPEDGDGDWESVLDSILGVEDQDWEMRSNARKNASAGVSIITHCSYDCPMYAVAIGKTEKTAYRGYPKKVEIQDIDPSWDERLRKFCDLMGIKVGNKKPTWWMCSLWG